MIFPTVQFAVFFPLILGLSWWLMPRPRLWKPFMVVASYAFYGAAGATFCLLLAGITIWNQLAALAIQRSPEHKKAIVRIAVVGDLAVLGVFKYYGFFATQINDVLSDFGLG